MRRFSLAAIRSGEAPDSASFFKVSMSCGVHTVMTDNVHSFADAFRPPFDTGTYVKCLSPLPAQAPLGAQPANKFFDIREKFKKQNEHQYCRDVAEAEGRLLQRNIEACRCEPE